MNANAPLLPTLLVAEDHSHDKFILTEVFRRAGIGVDLRFVSDGEEVLDYLHRRGRFADPAVSPPPALLLLDLNMPRLDGRKVVLVLRAEPGLRHLPIIALSTSDSPKHIVEAYALGINAYLVKPANIPAYVAKISCLWQFWMEMAALPTGAAEG